ncbi:MAG: PEP-CTERM sorting domain-containing protein [Verrucomicrobiota bacterium]
MNRVLYQKRRPFVSVNEPTTESVDRKMKNRIPGMVYLFVAVFAFGATAMQAAVIVDGTGPDYKLDGSFESEEADPWKGADGNTNLATDLGIEKNIIFRDVAEPSDGSLYTVVGHNASDTEDYGVFIDTGHNLSLDETFDLSFWHGKHGGTGWDSGDQEEMRWQLFTTTTDGDDGTIKDTLATGTVEVPNDNKLTEASFSDIGTVTSTTAGARLFLAFTPEVSSDDYFALDEVNLNVIPEPGTLALLILGAVSLLCRRRWRG